MTTRLEELIAQAMTLSSEDRAILAQLLLESLNASDDYDAAWEQEIDRRLEEIDSGSVQLIPIEDALGKVRSTLK